MAQIEFIIDQKSYLVAAEENETVLDAALRSSVPARYSCLEGVCSSCTARVLSGQVATPWGKLLAPTADAGEVQTCQVRIAPGCEKLIVSFDGLD